MRMPSVRESIRTHQRHGWRRRRGRPTRHGRHPLPGRVMRSMIPRGDERVQRLAAAAVGQLHGQCSMDLRGPTGATVPSHSDDDTASSGRAPAGPAPRASAGSRRSRSQMSLGPLAFHCLTLAKRQPEEDRGSAPSGLKRSPDRFRGALHPSPSGRLGSRSPGKRSAGPFADPPYRCRPAARHACPRAPHAMASTGRTRPSEPHAYAARR